MSDRRRSHPTNRLPQDSLAYAILEASRLVEKVLGGQNLTDAFEHARHHARPLWPDAVRGAIRDLAWRALRDYGRGDLVLAQLLSKPLPDSVRAVLLVALQRLETRPDQSHTVVDQAVEAVAVVAPGLKGVVNGVLRNALRQAARLAELVERDPVSHYRHPSWWIDRVRRSFPDDWEGVLEAANQPPPMSLRGNLRRTTVDYALAALREDGFAVRRLANDALLLEQPVPVTALPGFAEGRLSVQDAGAQWAARWLDPHAGQRVLDACAAPGGKSAHLLEYADVDLLSLEIDPVRAERIDRNFARLGLRGETRIGDAREPNDWWDGRPFDCILADVPCSASGVVRRHPDIKWLRREKDIRGFVAQQAAILDSLWRTLAPGGRMLYVTCSLFDDENRVQVSQFLARHPDAKRIQIDGADDRQLLPTAENDGFYYALLRKSD
ncbi:MAG TPA: 16S rRNA (cytosine(967)-C(5))-methyltransferase RsmB [Azoarcus taiwanensis]|nr:16S rRNA (cytosine(967)-C(5))-methyltransferase RsmB [Azoarcus taiwanensis]